MPICLNLDIYLDRQYVDVLFECDHWGVLVGSGDVSEALTLECGQLGDTEINVTFGRYVARGGGE